MERCPHCGQVKPVQPDTADAFELLCYTQPFCFGAQKAGDIIRRFNPLPLTLHAWRQAGLSRQILLWAIQRFPDVGSYRRFMSDSKTDVGAKKSPEERQISVLTKRAESAKEEEAVPAPPEFYEAVKRLRQCTDIA